MYVFWWHKPLGVEQPTIISSDSSSAADEVLAYLYMTTKRLPVPYRTSYSEMPEAADIHHSSTLRPAEQSTGTAAKPTTFDRTFALTVWRWRFMTWATPWLTKSPMHHKVDDADRETPYVEKPQSGSRTGEENPVEISTETLLARRGRTFLPHNVELQAVGLSYKHGDVTLSKSDVLRWVLAMRLLKDDEAESPDADSSADLQDRLTDRVPDLPPLDLDPSHLDWHLLLAFNISSMLYGGLHALAWNVDFASDTRRFFWRLSTVGVMGFFALSTLVLAVERLLYHEAKAENVALKASYFVLYRLQIAGVRFCAGLLTFLAARTYLSVECYITLTDLPKEAYDMPLWSRFVPHI